MQTLCRLLLLFVFAARKLDISIPGAHTSDQNQRHNLDKSNHGLSCFVVFVSCSARLFSSFPKQYYNIQNVAWYIIRKVAWGTCCLIRFIAPMPEASFFVNSSMWLLQSSFLSMVTPSDFAMLTWLTWLSLIVIVGESVRVLNFCLETMSKNSVLFRVNFPQPIVIFSKSWFKI